MAENYSYFMMPKLPATPPALFLVYSHLSQTRQLYRDNWQQYRELYPNVDVPAPDGEA